MSDPFVASQDDGHEHRRLLGKDIRSLRKSRGWTLMILAEHAGCSVGYLSEVERGERTVSIRFLRPIAEAFDVPLGFFFSHADQPADERGKIVRAQTRRRIGSSEEGLFEELLSPDLSGSFEMFLTRIDPGATSASTLFRDVEEEGYVLVGQLKLTIAERVFSLHQGDSFRIHNEAFSWINPGNTVTQIVWVTSPPVF